MCQRCDKANANFRVHGERIMSLVSEATQTLQGNYSEHAQEMINDEPFPEDKPFMEFLFRFGSAAQQLAIAASLITGEAVSVTIGQWAGLALETEMDLGMLSALTNVFGADVADNPNNFN